MQKRILIVDDEPAVRAVIKRLLELLDYEIQAVQSGEEALRELHQGGQFDLVLTDNRMNGMSGVELAEKIKQINPTMPVVLLSGTPPASCPSFIDRIIMKPVPQYAFVQLGELIK